MSALEARFPGLDVPRVKLGLWPTPVAPLAVDLPPDCALWLKREDQSSPLYGGHKIRKLEYVLGAARARFGEGGGALVTGGAVGSHHVVGTLLHGAPLGMQVHAVLLGQPDTPRARAHARITVARAASYVALGRKRHLPRALARLARELARPKRPPPMLIPAGGSSAAGVLGAVGLGMEIAADVEAGRMPRPDSVVLPLGTGGTAAGVWLGLRLAGLDAEVIAVRVGPTVFAHPMRLGKLAWEAAALLPPSDVPLQFPPDGLRVVHHMAAPGYGRFSAAAEAARIKIADAGGPPLEQTYSGRAMAVALDEIRRGRAGSNVLFIHTPDGGDLERHAQGTPPTLPPPVEALLEAGGEA